MPPRISIPGAPSQEHQRSHAALRVARMARESGLFFSHFEHRVQLDLPPAWTRVQDRQEERAGFRGGVLPEPKYQAFRHDLLVASFHPNHRAKWTAHELCHGLVGFAYRPGASSLFHALSAWLAELLPVALWYFFDEAGLERCADHTDGGPLFQGHCQACELAALSGARPLRAKDERVLRAGLAYVDRELAAVARSRRLGRPQGTRHATIDLASDGLAYAAAHGPRLRAPEMARFVGQFFAAHQGHHDSLDSLEARVIEARDAIVKRGRIKPWGASSWDYVAQDLGYRLLTVRARAKAATGELDAIIDRLAARRTRAGVARCIADYESLMTEHRGRRRGLPWPAPSELFAVGYRIPRGYGSSARQLGEGIASACPHAAEGLGRQAALVAQAFATADRPERAPLGKRFAAWLARHKPGPLADLARVEAAITHVGARDPVAEQLEPEDATDGRVRLSRGAELVRIRYDVLGVPTHAVRRLRPDPSLRTLLIARADAHEVDVLELPEAVARRLERGGERGVERRALGLDEQTVESLLQSRLLVPVQYACE